jgi:hypothetical protein
MWSGFGYFAFWVGPWLRWEAAVTGELSGLGSPPLGAHQEVSVGVRLGCPRCCGTRYIPCWIARPPALWAPLRTGVAGCRGGLGGACSRCAWPRQAPGLP